MKENAAFLALFSEGIGNAVRMCRLSSSENIFGKIKTSRVHLLREDPVPPAKKQKETDYPFCFLVLRGHASASLARTLASE